MARVLTRVRLSRLLVTTVAGMVTCLAASTVAARDYGQLGSTSR